MAESAYHKSMIPLLAIVFLAPQTGTITFSTPGAPFDQVCKQLAKQTDLKIVPTGDLREEVIALDVREMPGKEVIDRLAHVLYAKAALKNGEWVFKGDV